MSVDVLIVGAGVIGCSIAHALSRAGAGRIVVVDRGTPGGEASGAAAGLLVTASSRAPRGVLYELKRASAALFPSLVEELGEETGIDVDYSRAGLIDLAFTAGEADRLVRLAARRREQGFSVDLLDRAAALGLEPALSPSLQSAALFHDDRSIDPKRLVEALHAAARKRGVAFHLGTPVTAIVSAKQRVVAVEAGSERFEPGELVIAAGTWSPEIGALLRKKVPVRPDRGEILVFRSGVPLAHALSWNDGYLVPRAGGEILVGSTSARGEWEKVVTPSSIDLLRRRAASMVPQLHDAPLARSWAGLRPLSTLRRPIIGRMRGYENVVLATGHHRNGVLLAPITAKLVAEILLGDATSVPIGPFCYRAR